MSKKPSPVPVHSTVYVLIDEDRVRKAESSEIYRSTAVLDAPKYTQDCHTMFKGKLKRREYRKAPGSLTSGWEMETIRRAPSMNSRNDGVWKCFLAATRGDCEHVDIIHGCVVSVRKSQYKNYIYPSGTERSTTNSNVSHADYSCHDLHKSVRHCLSEIPLLKSERHRALGTS